MITILLIFAGAFVLSWVPVLIRYLVERHRESGDRVITCPGNQKTAVVRLDAGHAAWTNLGGERKLRLDSCSRWPERADCGRECLREVEVAPDGCLVRARLEDWYRGARCALCGLWIGSLNWFEIRPGLLTPEGRPLSWAEIPAEELPAALAACRPICSDCYLAESFRDQFPDRVIDDPWHTVNRKKTRATGTTR
jgi:hypothetical protein